MDDLIIKHLQVKANELGINTGFLIQCLDSCSKANNETETLKKYIYSVADFQCMKANENSHRPDRSIRKQAEYILAFAKKPAIESIQQSGYSGYLSISNYYDLYKPLKLFQYEAWRMAIDDVLIIEKLIKNNKNLLCHSFLEIINVLMPEEVTKFKDFLDKQSS